jgi:hypothetical protein
VGRGIDRRRRGTPSTSTRSCLRVRDGTGRRDRHGDNSQFTRRAGHRRGRGSVGDVRQFAALRRVVQPQHGDRGRRVVALRTFTVQNDLRLHVRFYFRAAAAPATSGCRMYAAQMNPADGSTAADALGVRGRRRLCGPPHDVRRRRRPAPGSTPPNICDGTWWRVEALVAYADFYAGTGVRAPAVRRRGRRTTTITFSWTGSYSVGGIDTVLLGQPRSALTSGQSWSAWFDNVDLWIGGWLGP